MSIQFYNDNADSFISSTQQVDMSELYQSFLPKIKAHGHILDAGCGSGRDSKAFLDLGFKVTAFDASLEMVKAAELLLGQNVQLCTFQKFQSQERFDAIWACASLLHVPADELPKVFKTLSQTLKPKGLFYCSFKYGDTDMNRGGRAFTNATEERLQAFVQDGDLHIEKTWISTDLRPGRDSEQWLNAILVKLDE